MSLDRRTLGARERGVPAGASDPIPRTPDGGRETEPLVPEGGRDRADEEERDRPEARRDIAGDGGAGREDVRDIADWVLSLCSSRAGGWQLRWWSLLLSPSGRRWGIVGVFAVVPVQPTKFNIADLPCLTRVVIGTSSSTRGTIFGFFSTPKIRDLGMCLFQIQHATHAQQTPPMTGHIIHAKYHRQGHQVFMTMAIDHPTPISFQDTWPQVVINV